MRFNGLGRLPRAVDSAVCSVYTRKSRRVIETNDDLDNWARYRHWLLLTSWAVGFR